MAYIFPNQDITTIDFLLGALPSRVAVDEASTLGTVQYTTPTFCRNSDGTSWTIMFCYYAAYASHQQLMSLDTRDGLIKNDDTTSFVSESWHQYKMVPADTPTGTKSYNNPPESGDRIGINSY